ncbi:MAG: rRNA (uracil1498-N3)-methyltransferase [Actinomycetota bacterium]|nr:rRNA (uracil1498-N3)-methyltransferase [Actinomycetota bacterium]
MASRPTYPVYLLPGLTDPQPGQRLELAGPEGRHAVAVRRHRIGQELVLTAGDGCWARGPIVEIRGRDSLILAVREAGRQPAPDPAITVVQALPKGERADLAVELLTEVGVDRIVVWQAHRCVAKWGPDKVDRGLARWRRTAAEAAKQSRRVWLPVVEGPVQLSGLVEIVRSADHSYVLHEGAAASLVDDLAAATGSVEAATGRAGVAAGETFALVVGPEGGIDDEELAELVAAGADEVRLGPTVLRTSTAGAVAATLVSAAIGRLSRDRPQGSGSTGKPS